MYYDYHDDDNNPKGSREPIRTPTALSFLDTSGTLIGRFIEWNYGVLQAHGNKTNRTYTPKPAYTAAVVLQNHIRGRQFVRRHSITAEVHEMDADRKEGSVSASSIFILEFEGGEIVAWTNSTVANASVSVPGASNACYAAESMLGEPEGLVHGGQTITVGDSPVYLRRQVRAQHMVHARHRTSFTTSITLSGLDSL